MPYKDPEKHLQYMRDYHWQHRTKTNLKSKQYYQDHKEERKIKDKDYHQKHKAHRNEMNKKWKHELREKLAIEIGSKCCVCGSEPKSPIYHEKNFKPHIGLTSEHSGESNPKYIFSPTLFCRT